MAAPEVIVIDSSSDDDFEQVQTRHSPPLSQRPAIPLSPEHASLHDRPPRPLRPAIPLSPEHEPPHNRPTRPLRPAIPLSPEQSSPPIRSFPSSFSARLRSLVDSRSKSPPPADLIPIDPNSNSQSSLRTARGRGRPRGSRRGRARTNEVERAPSERPPLPHDYSQNDLSLIDLTPSLPDFLPPDTRSLDSLHDEEPLIDLSQPTFHPTDPLHDRAGVLDLSLPSKRPQSQPLSQRPPPTVAGPDLSSDISSGSRSSRRDRDDVELVVSRELGASTNTQALLLGKLLALDGHERNITARVDALPSPNMIQWRLREAHTIQAAAYYYDPDQFIAMMRANTVDDLARTLRTRHGNARIFIILGSIIAYCRRTARRAATAGVPAVSSAAVEDCCNALYLDHGLTARAFDDADEIAAFCAHIAYAVGRRAHADALTRAHLRKAYVHGKTGARSAALCVDGAGGVRAENRQDMGAAYQAFLAMVPGVSVGRARAIRRAFPSLASLMKAYQGCGGERERVAVLSGVAERGRAIGPKISSKIARALTETDPDVRIC